MIKLKNWFERFFSPRKQLLEDLDAWKAFGCADDIMFRPEFARYVARAKAIKPGATVIEIIELVEKELSK